MDANSVGADLVQVVILVVLWGLILALVALSHPPQPQGMPVPAKKVRPLKPKTGDDCALCRSSLMLKPEAAGRCLPSPWSTVRSRRGPKKHSDTEGFACDNLACGIFSIIQGRVKHRGADLAYLSMKVYSPAC